MAKVNPVRKPTKYPHRAVPGALRDLEDLLEQKQHPATMKKFKTFPGFLELDELVQMELEEALKDPETWIPRFTPKGLEHFAQLAKLNSVEWNDPRKYYSEEIAYPSGSRFSLSGSEFDDSFSLPDNEDFGDKCFTEGFSDDDEPNGLSLSDLAKVATIVEK